MYRVVENIFSNIYKYALENSRVYIDIKEENHNIKLEIKKHFKKNLLNITEDELMEICKRRQIKIQKEVDLDYQ